MASWTAQMGLPKGAWPQSAAWSQQPPYAGPPGWGPSGQFPPQEHSHVDKRPRLDPHAFVDQAQLFAAQTGRQPVPRYGGRPGAGKHAVGPRAGGGGGGRHHKHSSRAKAQVQQDLESLPDASNYLVGYPATKDLMRQFKERGVEQSPLAVVNEYAARMMQQVVFDMRQESLSGGFWVEARLVGKRSPEPVEVAAGRARNKQIGKQVAAAALLERLLESSVDPESLLSPNAGDKAPKKWQPPQKPGLGMDPALLKFGGGPPYRRYGAPRFVRGGTIVPVAGGLEYLPGSTSAHARMDLQQRQHQVQRQERQRGAVDREPLYRRYEREREAADRRHAEEQRRRFPHAAPPSHDSWSDREDESRSFGRDSGGSWRGDGRLEWGRDYDGHAQPSQAPHHGHHDSPHHTYHHHGDSHRQHHHEPRHSHNENGSHSYHNSNRHSHHRSRSRSRSRSKDCNRERGGGSSRRGDHRDPPASSSAAQLDPRWERMLHGSRGGAKSSAPAVAVQRQGSKSVARPHAATQQQPAYEPAQLRLPPSEPEGGSSRAGGVAGAGAGAAGSCDRWEMYAGDMAVQPPSLWEQPYGAQQAEQQYATHRAEQQRGAEQERHMGLGSWQEQQPQQQQEQLYGSSEWAHPAGLVEQQHGVYPSDYGAPAGSAYDDGGGAQRITRSTLRVSTTGGSLGGEPGQRIPHTMLSITIPNA